MSLRSKPPMHLLASDSIPPLKQSARRHTGLAPPADPVINRVAKPVRCLQRVAGELRASLRQQGIVNPKDALRHEERALTLACTLEAYNSVSTY